MPELEEHNYHVGYARATFQSLDDDIYRAIEESWRPGATVVRFGRRWHLTKVVDQTGDLFFGRIGFVSDNERSTLQFDRATQDFVYGEAPSGYVVPFVIRATDGVIAYQLYPGVVRETTFTGALEHLLNSTTSTFIWNVESFVETRTFDEWVSSTERVAKFDFTLERPNPNYHGRKRVEDLVEGTHVEAMRLVGTASPGEAVNTESAIFQEAVDHVIERDYGKAKIVGVDSEGAESTWQKRPGTPGRVSSQRTFGGVGTEEAPEDILVGALEDAPASSALTEASSDADEA